MAQPDTNYVINTINNGVVFLAVPLIGCIFLSNKKLQSMSLLLCFLKLGHFMENYLCFPSDPLRSESADVYLFSLYNNFTLFNEAMQNLTITLNIFSYRPSKYNCWVKIYSFLKISCCIFFSPHKWRYPHETFRAEKQSYDIVIIKSQNSQLNL